MNFIIEILKKKENENQFVWVVRDMTGFPLSVCDSADGAMDVIKEKFVDARKAMNVEKHS